MRVKGWYEMGTDEIPTTGTVWRERLFVNRE